MDNSLFYIFNNVAGQTAWLDLTVRFLAEYFGFILLFGLMSYEGLVFVMGGRKFPTVFFNSIALAGGAWLIGRLIKLIYASPRPFIVLEKVHQLIDHGGYDSFPSGHTTFFFTLGFALYFYNKTLGILFMVGAVVIGISRVIAGIHWPMDILGGILLGAGVVSIVRFLTYRIFGDTEFLKITETKR
jgi:undecaprenyl-diphosphatase